MSEFSALVASVKNSSQKSNNGLSSTSALVACFFLKLLMSSMLPSVDLRYLKYGGISENLSAIKHQPVEALINNGKGTF